MSTQQMRNRLVEHYGPGFAPKVKKMNDKQVQAIYLRLTNQGVLK